MGKSNTLRVLGAMGAAVGLWLGQAFSQSIPCEFDDVDRIVAIGDVHGAYDRLVDNLKATGIVDNRLDWMAGTTHLVQTGDVLDRGPESRKAMDLLMKLERQAEAAGGRVHALIGNHELWNAVGALDYVSDEELKAFDGERDRELRKALVDDTARPGELALREAYGAGGIYGQWMRGHNAVIRIGELIFVHGGITPETAALGLSEINERVRRDLDEPQWLSSFSMLDDGPLMTRRYSGEYLSPDELKARDAEIGQVLGVLGARTMVMGHTVTFGLVEPRFHGKAILIDAGMFDGYLGGHQGTLIIEDGIRYAVYPDGRLEIPPSLDGDAGARYIEAVVAAASDAPGLKQRLAALRARQGRFREAAELYESIGVVDPSTRVPYFWRKEAAETFAAAGNEKQAADLYDLYLQGMRITAERSDGGIPLLHAYSRECLRLGLQLDDAFDAARLAAEAYPDNMSFKVTLAWAWLAKGDARRAARVTSLAMRQGEDSVLAYYVLGRAQAELRNTDEALLALRAALERDPDNEDVKAALTHLEKELR